MLQRDTANYPSLCSTGASGCSILVLNLWIIVTEQSRDTYPVFPFSSPGILKERNTQINTTKSVDPSATWFQPQTRFFSSNFPWHGLPQFTEKKKNSVSTTMLIDLFKKSGHLCPVQCYDNTKWKAKNRSRTWQRRLALSQPVEANRFGWITEYMAFYSRLQKGSQVQKRDFANNPRTHGLLACCFLTLFMTATKTTGLIQA